MTNFVTYFNEDFVHEDIIMMSKFLKIHMDTPYQFSCYTKSPIDSVESLLSAQKLSGEWMLLNTFEQTGPTVVLDPNIFIVGNLKKLSKIATDCPKNRIYLCRPKNKKLLNLSYGASRIMVFNGDWSWLLKDFKTKSKWPAIYINEQLKKKNIKAKILQDKFKGIYYYDKSKELPDDAKLVLFSKKNRPSTCKEPWTEMPIILEEEYE
jgi:hypothetical protein